MLSRTTGRSLKGATFMEFQGTSPTERHLSGRRVVGPSFHEVAAFPGFSCWHIRVSCMSPFLEPTSPRLGDAPLEAESR